MKVLKQRVEQIVKLANSIRQIYFQLKPSFHRDSEMMDIKLQRKRANTKFLQSLTQDD
jgi:hypothetical protein